MKPFLSHRGENLLRKIEEAAPIEADFMYGLTDGQAEARRKEGLANKTKKKVTKSYARIVFDNFLTFFNIVFFVIAGLMMAGGLPITSYFFLAPLSLNILIGLIADIRVRLLTDKLRVVTEERSKVMRNGKEVTIPVDEIVLSDIVVLSSGDQVPCDAKVVSGYIDVDESLLTGESEAVRKDEESHVYSGSFVRAGKAYVRVEKVGAANYAETLQSQARLFTRPKSEIKRTCLVIFWTTGIIAILMGIAMFATELAQNGWFKDLSSYQEFIKSLSGSLVAMIPAGLYVLTSTTLAIGVYNLSRKKMNVQELYCIEMLARVDVLCFDKTGTLTDGRLAVQDLYHYSDFTDEEIRDILHSLVQATGDSNATAEAVSRYAASGKSVAYEFALPFDSARKYSAATLEGKGTFILGASEFIGGKVPPIASLDAKRLMKSGYRVLGLFYSKDKIYEGKIPSKSTMICQISLSDNIKSDAKANIEWFQKSCVSVRIISGDNPLTVSHIAAECGVIGADRFVSMEGVKDEQIPELVKDKVVFGRVSPEQKALIVQALQEEGHKVAMTGDGVNDIIALKKADCSIAMASGSAAARNAAHIVSLENDFSKLPDVVREGRRVINNIQRTASLFLAKTIFAIVLSIVFLIADWAIDASYPFETRNLTIWEFFSIGVGGFLLALQPSNEPLKGTVFWNILSKALPAGGVAILSVGLSYLFCYLIPGLWNEPLILTISTICFTLISLFTLFRTCLPFDRYRTAVFILITIGVVGAIILDRFVFYPLGSELFNISFSAIGNNPYGSWAVVLLMAAILAISLALYFVSVVLIAKLGRKEEKDACAIPTK